MALETQLRDRLATATDFHREAVTLLQATTLSIAAETARNAVARGKLLLARAVQIASIGDVTLARRLAESAVDTSDGLLSKASIDEPLREQTARLSAVERSFEMVAAEASRQQTGWRSLFGELLPALNSHDELRTRLDECFGHQQSTRWGPGSELGRGFVAFVRKCRDWCELAHYKPVLRSWAGLHEALERTRAREVHPAMAFVNALCAMAHTHDGLSDEESLLISQIIRERRLPVTKEQVEGSIRQWQSLPRDQRTLQAIAQAIVDVRAITAKEMLEDLSSDLRRVAKADNELANDEITVYHGFITTLTRLMYPTFGA